MLIKGLSDYYDILASAGKVLPDGYSSVKIHYLVSLTEEGVMDGILDIQEIQEVPVGKGKIKQKKVPRDFMMPQRTEKPGIDANIAEHRPLYLFGLNLTEGGLTPEDRTGKAKKSHEAFVKISLEFLDGLDSPLINAFHSFVLNWRPEAETENPFLLELGKDYAKSGFAFCLSGNPDRPLHEEVPLKQKWKQVYGNQLTDGDDVQTAQCAVSGEIAPIARIHNKIKGVYGGLPTGSVLIGFNNSSENSYGKEQSYNSNVSERVMKKYTEALNYLLGSNRHRILLDEMTVVFWAMNPSETCEDLFMKMFFDQSDQMNASRTEKMLESMWRDARTGRITEGRLDSLEQIDPDVDFYMLGLKPNSSRLSVKFIIRKKYADVLWNIARFQSELQVSKETRPISLQRIKMEMVTPKSKNDKVNPALLTGLFESVIYDSPYPAALLETMIRRVKTDTDKVNAVRVGVIKACINRNYTKGELKMALDRGNKNQAYLCGRLFAVLERLQQEASGGNLNRTIKDAYFSSASAKPVLVFPKLINLAQNHLRKVKRPVFFNKLIGEIIESLDGGFPDTFRLKEQGEFIVGYYQQYQSFFEKAENKKEMEVE